MKGYNVNVDKYLFSEYNLHELALLNKHCRMFFEDKPYKNSISDYLMALNSDDDDDYVDYVGYTDSIEGIIKEMETYVNENSDLHIQHNTYTNDEDELFYDFLVIHIEPK